MNFYILICFIAPFLYGLVNIVEAVLTTQKFQNPLTMLFYMSLTGLMFLPTILFFGTPDIPPAFELACFFVLGAIDILYQIPYYTALKKTDTSIVGALFSLGRIFVPVFSFVFLRERLGVSQYAGFAVIIVSSLLLSIKNFKMPVINTAFYLMFLSSAMRSAYTVFEKYTIDKNGNWTNMVVWPPVFSMLILTVFLVFKNYRGLVVPHFREYIRKVPSFAAVELFCFVASSVIFFVLPHISAVAKTSVMATIPIFTLAEGLIIKAFLKRNAMEELSVRETVKKSILFLTMSAGVYFVVS